MANPIGTKGLRGGKLALPIFLPLNSDGGGGFATAAIQIFTRKPYLTVTRP
ncbi:MAG: hypothetical protein R2825_10255 [Saprospiraceae bacterium]